MIAISNAARRLDDLGVMLAVRSPSVLVDQILSTKTAAEDSRADATPLVHDRLGAEGQNSSSVVSNRFLPRLSSSDPRRLTAMPVDPDVMDSVFELVVELARAGVSGADGASISLLRHGVLTTVAASDHTIRSMDAGQYASGEGPCIDAATKGRWFHAASLETETRWPHFTPVARDLGIHAILSSPLKTFGVPIGALNIYSRTADTFGIKDQEAAAAFAQKASTILGDAGTTVSEAELADRFQEALRSRRSIALATGIFMERHALSDDDALTKLLRQSLHSEESLRRHAERIAQSTRRTDLGSLPNADG